MAVMLIAAVLFILGFVFWYLRFGKKTQCRSCGYYYPARAERCPHCGFRLQKDEVAPLVKRSDRKD